HQLGLWTVGDPVKHVYVKSPLDCEEGGEEADRPCPSDEHGMRIPKRALPDIGDVLPCLGEHARRFEQHTAVTEPGVDLHRVIRLGPPTLPREPVPLLDAAFRVLAVEAHVRLTCGAGRARHWVGSAHQPDDEVAGLELRRAALDDPAERLMPQDQPIVRTGSLAILPAHDLPVGPADAHGERLDEHLSLARIWLWKIIDNPGRVRLSGVDHQTTHTAQSSCPQGATERARETCQETRRDMVPTRARAQASKGAHRYADKPRNVRRKGPYAWAEKAAAGRRAWSRHRYGRRRSTRGRRRPAARCRPREIALSPQNSGPTRSRCSKASPSCTPMPPETCRPVPSED